jgi:hypothetical protein
MTPESIFSHLQENTMSVDNVCGSVGTCVMSACYLFRLFECQFTHAFFTGRAEQNSAQSTGSFARTIS